MIRRAALLQLEKDIDKEVAFHSTMTTSVDYSIFIRIAELDYKNDYDRSFNFREEAIKYCESNYTIWTSIYKPLDKQILLKKLTK